MYWTDFTRLGVFLTASMALAEPALAKPPLSASDWLSGSVKQPDNISSWRPGDKRPPNLRSNTQREIAATGAVEPVGVTRLGEGNADGKGTVSPRSAGLTPNLWGPSDVETLVRLIGGAVFASGMLLMAWNCWCTLRSGDPVRAEAAAMA